MSNAVSSVAGRVAYLGGELVKYPGGELSGMLSCVEAVEVVSWRMGMGMAVA